MKIKENRKKKNQNILIYAMPCHGTLSRRPGEPFFLKKTETQQKKERGHKTERKTLELEKES